MHYHHFQVLTYLIHVQRFLVNFPTFKLQGEGFQDTKPRFLAATRQRGKTKTSLELACVLSTLSMVLDSGVLQ